MAEERLLTSSEAARQLGVSDDSVRRLETRGLLPCERLGNGVRLFREGDVEAVRPILESRPNRWAPLQGAEDGGGLHPNAPEAHS